MTRTRYGDVYAALSAAEVPFVVVGGTAVVLQGHVRMTVDLDLVLDLREDPLRRALGALLGLGLLPRLPVDPFAFADAATRELWRRERSLVVFSLYDPQDPFKEVDLFAEEPLPFAELLADATVVDLDGTPVRVASLAHLKAMKRAAGRPRDLEDVAALEQIEDGG